MALEKMIYGKIYLGDEKETVVSALGIADGKIAYCGDAEGAASLVDASTEVITLPEGQLVMAGFMDGHNHLAPIMAASAELYNVSEHAASTSADLCVAEIAAFVKEHPEFPVYLAHNWTGGIFENGTPTADLLDVIDTDKGICVFDSGNHSYWTNTKMMQLAGVTRDIPDPEGGKIERYPDGEPCGCFRDTAIGLIQRAFPKHTPESRIPGILKGQELYAHYGYTGFFDALTNEQSSPLDYPVMKGFEMIDRQGKLYTYVQGSFVINNDPNYMEQLEKGILLRNLTRGGQFEMTTIKIFMDGVVEGTTGYLSEPYANDSSNYGACRWVGEEAKNRLYEITLGANKAGMPCHYHAVGDQAISDVLDCLERVYAEIGEQEILCRNTITHLQVVKESDIPRFKKLGVIASIDPWACKSPGFYAETEVVNLGEERASNEYPYRSFLDAGVLPAFATDFGCSFICEPIDCFHTLTTRTYRDDNPATTLKASECFTRKEAIRVMTANVAYQMHVEDRLGTLEKGMIANLIILSQDLLTIPDNQIMSTKVLATMCNGSWVFKAE